MFYKMIEKKCKEWYNSKQCTINDTINYITETGKMRDAQIEAIKVYLYLKIACDCKPLVELFCNGTFNSIDLNEIEISKNMRDFLEGNPAAAALFEYSRLKNDKGEQVSKEIEKEIKEKPLSIDYENYFREAFYGVSYTDYLFSLPMGAGKTYLMAAFIYLDLYFAINEPSNPAFAHNFIIFAPSGLKSSVIPSLRTIQNFNPAWIIAEPYATNIKKMISFEVLDQTKSANKSNKTKNPNVQKISNHQPFSELFGLVAVTNAEKVIYDRLEKEDLQLTLFNIEEQLQIKGSIELRSIIGKIPQLAIFIDEVHHASAAGDSKLRKVVTKWAQNNTVNSVVGFSGTPYLEKQEKLKINDSISVGNDEITNIVYYYPIINGIGNFLKRPNIKIIDISDSSLIIEKGVREFLNTYKDTVYSNGLTAKLGIYCGTIERLENVVFPKVSEIVKEYGLSPDVILKFHKGNKEYKISVDSQMEFDILDKDNSTKRIVLLVQVGKEGWDCRSLTGIILSQEGDCPKNMVLQTSCRCLRQVVKGNPETALIYLNESNANKLKIQLEQQYHTTLKDFSSGTGKKTLLKRYDRTKRLELPEVDFYQLKINYDTLVVDKANPKRDIAVSADTSRIADGTIKSTDFSMEDSKTSISFIDDERGAEPATFNSWVYGIMKGGFGKPSITDMMEYSEQLKEVYLKITYEQGGRRYYSSKYNRRLVEANIRKAFIDKRDYNTTEELVPEKASLLNISNFTLEIYAENIENYYPEQKTVEYIIKDDNGELKLDPYPESTIRAFEDQGYDDTAKKLREQNTAYINKDRSFHYLPYHTDSDFEQTFLKEVLSFDKIQKLGLEVYYNGDRSMTEFKIKCYKNDGSKWNSVGLYTPDFLIIKREDGEIHKVLIVETKGKIYANDPSFKDKKAFMETKFNEQNEDKYGYKRFDYLYLEDTLLEKERINLTSKKIDEFFNNN